MREATAVPSLVLPEAPDLAYLAKWTLRVVFLLGVSLALARQAAAAPVVFDASGEFENGSELSGTVTIDTATGVVLSADLSITNDTGETYLFNDRVSAKHYGSWTTISFGGAEILPVLVLSVEGRSLVGYDGSSILPLYDAGFLLSGIVWAGGLYYSDESPLLSGILEPN